MATAPSSTTALAPTSTSTPTLPTTTLTPKSTSISALPSSAPTSIKLKMSIPRPSPCLIPVRFNESSSAKAGLPSLSSKFRCVEVGDEKVVAMHLERIGSTSTRGKTGVASSSASRGNSVLGMSDPASTAQGTIGTGLTMIQEEVIPKPRPSKRKSLAQNPFLGVNSNLNLNSSSASSSGMGSDPSGSKKSVVVVPREDPYQTIMRGCKGGLWKGEGNYRCTRVWRGKDGSSSSSSSGGSVPISTISTRSAANTKKSVVPNGGTQSGTRSKQKKTGGVVVKSVETGAKSSTTSSKEPSNNKSTLTVPGLTTTVPSPSPLRMAYSQPNSPEEETGKVDTMDRLDPLRAIRALSESGMAESSKKRRRGSKEYDDEYDAALSLGERAGSSPPVKRQVRATAAASGVAGKRISPRLSHAIPVRYENGLGSESTPEDEGDTRRGRSSAPETGVGSGQPTDASGLGKMLLRREVERKKRAATHSPPGGTNGVEGDVADEQDASKKSAPAGLRRTLSHDTATAIRGEGELGMAAGRSRREVGPPRHLRDYEMEIAV